MCLHIHSYNAFCYQFYQLGTGGCTQKAKPVQGVYPKPRSLRNKRPRWDWTINLEHRKNPTPRPICQISGNGMDVY